jgi:hypothetical protein
MSAHPALDSLTAAVGAVLRDHFTVLLSERQSHLGVTPHREAVIRRIASGEPGAILFDGKYFLTLEAHDEEYAIAMRLRPRPKMPSEPPKGGAHAG